MPECDATAASGEKRGDNVVVIGMLQIQHNLWDVALTEMNGRLRDEMRMVNGGQAGQAGLPSFPGGPGPGEDGAQLPVFCRSLSAIAISIRGRITIAHRGQ